MKKIQNLIILTVIITLTSCTNKSIVKIIETNEKCKVMNDNYAVGDTVILYYTLDGWMIDKYWIHFNKEENSKLLGTNKYVKGVVLK